MGVEANQRRFDLDVGVRLAEAERTSEWKGRREGPAMLDMDHE